MTNLEFQFEWIDPQGAKIAEHRATWASLRIEIDGQIPTRVHDRRLNSVRDHLYLPLYPLAEWIAQQWWNLLYESPTPNRSTDADYSHRHHWQYAREGFALPEIASRPDGSRIHFEWRARELEAYALEFIRSGSAILDRSLVEERLASLVQAVIERLEQQGLGETLLQQDWAAIEEARSDPEEAAFCIAAAALGANPYDLDETLTERILEADRLLPESLEEIFFHAADPEVLERQLDLLRSTLETLESIDVDARPLVDLRRDLTTQDVPGAPWREGYAMAREVRRRLDAVDRPVPDFPSLAEMFRTPSLDGLLREVSSSNLFDALVASNRRGHPSFALERKRDERGRRFAFCRGLFEYLASSNGAPSMVTRTRTERQQRNRAFAAELLAPSIWLRERIDTKTVEREEIEDWSSELGVSPFVVEHQLENHRLARVVA